MSSASTTAADRKPSSRTPYRVRTPTARSKLTNGTRGMVLPGIDQRSAIARQHTACGYLPPEKNLQNPQRFESPQLHNHQ